MPEIAEVRVVANTLRKQILEKRIEKVKVLYGNIIVGNINEFINNIENSTIRDIKTNGKWLLFNLGEYTLLSHLRMEGKFIYVNKNYPVSKHTHVIFNLDNSMDLRFLDTRKFGRMQLVKTTDVSKTECIKKLGLEPDDKNLTPEYILEKLKNKRIPIKTILLDQTIINGLGNIYANEVLFLSKINPLKKGNEITYEDAQNIILNSRKVIEESYKMGGCTIRSYTSGLGVIGHYQEKLLVHKRAYEKCKVCGSLIKCIDVNGRSTYYCENCQK